MNILRRVPLTSVTRLALLVICLLAASASLRASSFSQAAANQQAGPFDFPDEDEDVPTWTDDLRAQAVDLALVGAFTVLAFVSFFRKSDRLKVVTLVAAVAYLGVTKSQLISIVNVFGLFGGNLPIFRPNLAWYLLALVTLVSTILWGRVYCGRMCAFGALTQLIDRVVPARWQVKVPRTLERRASYIKYAILIGVIGYFLITRDPLIYPYVEPFWLFGGPGHGTAVLWVMLTLLLIATVFVRNLYCRFLCPVGAFLGVVSKLTVFRIKRWGECRHCRICEKACEWGAIRGPQIVLTECVRCDDCERLYEDTKKCPHHLIIIRKEQILARRAAATPS
jgi:NosR/NirI family transcriptional regulator, nitrous oxide reductase regulator